MDQPRNSAHSSRRRRLWLLALCLILGAGTSIGVAWYAAWNAKPSWPAVENAMFPAGVVETSSHRVSAPSTLNTNDPKYVWQASRLAGKRVEVTEFRTLSMQYIDEPTLATFRRLTSDAASAQALRRHAKLLGAADTPYIDFSVTISGWPFRCLGSERASTVEQVIATKKGWRRNATCDFPLHLQPTYHAIEIRNHFLPTLPLWPGFLANTAIFAFAWSLVVVAPFALFRSLRARHARIANACPACGYSRAGLPASAPCPECGQPQ